ncbi:ras association domain-containing protein 9 [Syngnathoides biaculeatus]|uniref:ras association domain-containing protein 9 n=1 Tax=Syngnathoides biaculeatus TaxID=300417 RepID=UPI002ADD813C|nr:ras association domain-containing protein 9 [Syngnathoides biaculeatus]
MAPFGKNFLKARLKNRTKDTETTSGKEIQVTVCNEEKVVCGVTKHTTCADMIQALLEDHRSVPESKQLLHGEPKDFYLVECYKGFERVLPPLTRILRLWYAWGDQRPFIQFVLVKSNDVVPQRAMKATKNRTRYTRNPQALPVEKQKRVVRKAFRKLKKLHKESTTPAGTEEIDCMVQLILNQDQTIREQIQRMGALEAEIRELEGQEDYNDKSEACSSNLEELEELLQASDDVQQLELHVQRQQALIAQLCRDIEAEQGMAVGGEQEGASATPWTPSEDDESLRAELERMQAELRRSYLAGVSLHSQVVEVDKQLCCSEATWLSRDQECWQLASQLRLLQMSDAAQETTASDVGVKRKAIAVKNGSSPIDVTDTDSDTGISSTHSQDSLSPGLDFPPPMDTDV